MKLTAGERRRFRRAFGEFSEIDRVIVLNRMAGRSNREIAEFLFCETERVKKRFQRATRRLRKLAGTSSRGSR